MRVGSSVSLLRVSVSPLASLIQHYSLSLPRGQNSTLTLHLKGTHNKRIMSYYFCIVGTRDNPLYESELASKPSAPSGAASFFSSASSSTVPPSSASVPAPSETSSSGSGGAGGLFGFGSTTTAPTGKGLGFGRYRDKAVLQMIAHSAIDVVEDVSVTNGSM